MMIKLVITIVTALAGALAGKKLKLPAAFMTGSMIAVIALNYMTGLAYCPATAKPYVQVIAGAFIAMSITRQTVKDMRLIVKPLLAYLICLLVWALFCGMMMHVIDLWLVNEGFPVALRIVYRRIRALGLQSYRSICSYCFLTPSISNGVLCYI